MHVLDNPIWSALSGRHSSLALGKDHARRYPAQVAPFAAVSGLDPRAAREQLEQLVGPGPDGVCLLGDTAVAPEGWTLTVKGACLQLVAERPSQAQATAPVLDLGPEDLPEMQALIGRVYPGYFREGTPRMGEYVGVRQEGRLVCMAGVRFLPHGYDELSGVCTHPDFAGRGYAATLLTALVRRIRSRGSVPFLHVDSDNDRARTIYERLGFVVRTELSIRWLQR